MFNSALAALLSKQEDRRLHQHSTTVFLQQHIVALYFFLDKIHCSNHFLRFFHSSIKYFLSQISPFSVHFLRSFSIFFPPLLFTEWTFTYRMQTFMVTQHRNLSKSSYNFELKSPRLKVGFNFATLYRIVHTAKIEHFKSVLNCLWSYPSFDPYSSGIFSFACYLYFHPARLFWPRKDDLEISLQDVTRLTAHFSISLLLSLPTV